MPGTFRRLRLACMFIMAVATASLLLAFEASASSDVMPPSISSADVDRYADLLDASREQRQGMRRAHAAYLHDYGKLRTLHGDGLAELRHRVGAPLFALPDQRELERFFAMHRRVHEQLRDLDASYFGNIEPFLAEDQMEALDRVRGIRRRAVLTSDEFIRYWFMDWRFIEPLDLFDEAELDAEQRALTDDAARAVERDSLAHLERLARGTWRMYETWLREVERAGIGRGAEQQMNEDERRSLTSERIVIWQEVTDEHRRTFHQLRDAWRAGIDRMVDTLRHEDDDAWWTLYGAAVRTIEGRRVRGTADRWQRRVDRARSISRPSPAMMDEIDRLDDEFRRAQLSVIREQIVLTDRSNAGHVPHVRASMNQVAGEALQALRERDEKQYEEFARRLDGILGEEYAERLAEAMKSPERSERFEERMAAQLSERHADEIDPDPLIPGPINHSVITGFADALGLDDVSRMVLETLYADYRDAFDRIRANEIESVIRIYVGFRSVEDSSMMRYSPPETVQQRQTARERALQAINGLNERFLEDIAQAVLDDEQADEMWRLRLACAKGLLDRHITRPLYRALDYNAHAVNLLHVINAAQLTGDDDDAAVAVLAEYADALVQQSRSLHRAELLAEHTRSMAMAMAGLAEEDREEAAEQARDREDRLRAERQAAVALNSRILENWHAAVSPEAFNRLRRAFERAAYPRAFAQDDAAGHQLRLAIDLDNLARDQRETLREALLEYERELRSIQQEILAIIRDAEHYGLKFGSESREAVNRQEAAIAALEPRVEEINQRARLALAQTLSDEQLDRVGHRASR